MTAHRVPDGLRLAFRPAVFFFFEDRLLRTAQRNHGTAPADLEPHEGLVLRLGLCGWG